MIQSAQKFYKEMTVGDAMQVHPEAGLVFSSYHLGGCSHCSINEIENTLCKKWLNNLKTTLQQTLKNVGKGSFNLKVNSKEIYEYLKLKKYMTVVKLIM